MEDMVSCALTERLDAEQSQIWLLSGQLWVPGDAQKSGGLVRNERWSKYVSMRSQCTSLLRTAPDAQKLMFLVPYTTLTPAFGQALKKALLGH